MSDNDSTFNDHKAHYDSLKDLFEKYYRITLWFLGVVVAVITGLTFSSHKEYQDAIKAERDLAQVQIKTIREEAKIIALTEARAIVARVVKEETLKQIVAENVREKVVPVARTAVNQQTAIFTKRVDDLFDEYNTLSTFQLGFDYEPMGSLRKDVVRLSQTSKFPQIRARAKNLLKSRKD